MRVLLKRQQQLRKQYRQSRESERICKRVGSAKTNNLFTQIIHLQESTVITHHSPSSPMASSPPPKLHATITRSPPLFSSASHLHPPFSPNTTNCRQSPLLRRRHPISATISTHRRPPPQIPAADPTLLRRFRPDEPRKGADVLVEALERAGVSDVFAYPGGATMEIHQALTRSPSITNHLLRHEQGEIFAAEGYARSTGRPGICIATSGPGATNLVSGLADALLDSIPLVAITGQVPRRMIGTDAFQETPIVEVTRSITKHNYLVLDADDIPRIMKEAFFLATSGRPGPVLVDVPKDIQQQLIVPKWDTPIRLHGYISRLPKPPQRPMLEQVLRLISESRRPLLYIGGGCNKAAGELRRFADLTGIPVASTLMGLGIYPAAGELSLRILGMHGTVYANYAANECDLLLAFGVRFDDRVTGKVESFAAKSKIVHIDIDSAEIGKNKQPHVSICADVKPALEEMNAMIKTTGLNNRLDFSAWKRELEKKKKAYPLSYRELSDEAISPQYAVQVLDELTKGEAIVSTGVGQHQMWAAQFYNFKRPRQWLSSGGLGAMGFGLPAAAGAAMANPGAVVVDIDGDGSFIMNVQELAMVRVEKLPVKMMVLNNQHLGMVVQLEDRFYRANRADTYLGDPAEEERIYPDLVEIAGGFDIPAERVRKKGEVVEAIRRMLETPGPYLLDIVVPHEEHVLPMIPNGCSFKDTIVDKDGTKLS